MARPLYQSAATEPRELPPQGHAGLWFDKFCHCWRIAAAGAWTLSPDRADRSEKNPKLEWIQTVADGRTVGAPKRIEESALRLLRLVEGRGGRTAVFVTESRFVTGLGRSHPVENGFAWHPTLGTPYLPGSSVKGLVRAWARRNVADADAAATADAVDRLLGKPDLAGQLCFLDAVPTKPVTLNVDVMTPHYAGWDERNPPGDWRSPTPIPFLVTGKGTPFLFGLLPRHKVPAQELDRVLGWLTAALEWAGAGAKTAVGYGRMVRDSAASDRLARRLAQEVRLEANLRREGERRAALSPLERELEDIAQARKDLADGYLAWFKALEDGRWADDPEKQRAVADLIRAEMQHRGRWKPMSAKKKPEMDKAYQRTVAVIRFLEGKG